MFRYLFLVFLSIGIFTSCTTKNIDLLSKDSLYKLGLENTKIKSILHNNDVEGLMNITYLNPTSPQKYDKKYNEFLVGIYLDNNKEQYHVSLNTKKYVYKELLKKSSKLYKNIPSFNPYAKYYIIKFQKEKSKKLNFELVHNIYGKTTIVFDTF